MSEYEKIRERALSRANTLQNLQNSYKKKEIVVSSKQKEETLPQSTITSNAVDIITNVIGDNSKKTRTFLSDSLNGKQIILENVISQADMIKNAIKTKIQNKRRVVISNKKLKKMGLCSPLTRPCNDDIRVMHDLWWTYVKAVMKSCQSEAQLQARLYASDMVGARAYVSESTSPLLVGVCGIITAMSKNCFYLVVDTIPERRYVRVDESGNEIQQNNDLDDSTTSVSNRQKKKLARKQYLAERQSANAAGATIATTPVQQLITLVDIKTHNHNKLVLGNVLRLIKSQCNLAVVLPSLKKANGQDAVETLPSRTNSERNLSDMIQQDTDDGGGADEYGYVNNMKTPNRKDNTKKRTRYGTNEEEDESEGEGPETGNGRVSSTNNSDSGSNSNSDDEDDSSSNGGMDVEGETVNNTIATIASSKQSGATVTSIITSKIPLLVFNHNEKSEGGNLCILYGKHFMPDCKYDVDNK